MTFPLTVLNQTFDDAPSFAEAVLADAVVGGGRFEADTPPHVWLQSQVDSGQLDHTLVVGLTAWLARTAQGVAIAESVRIATALSLKELAPVFAAGLEGLALGVLLQPDPLAPDQSVEDLLLKGLAQLMDGSDATLRASVLIHLRNAGLREEEVQLLLGFGSTEELNVGLPSIFTETLPSPDTLVAALLRGPDIAQAIANCLGNTPTEYRQSIWDLAVKKAPLLAQNDALQKALIS